ncbi:LTA synthase family protein [Enterococcus gilvus]|nr:sulfatase-like hydrolase/transferase [Enterococcus gilvus]MDN6777047.1 sulfatase-like hydrolase/transferase [Enterococcus sp.]
MIMNHVLTSITVIPEYAQNPKRFYIYNILLGLTAIGGNLLALYLGYHSEKLKGKKPLQTLPGFYLIYVVLTFTINIVCKSFNLSDYWKIFFPISQNMFGFAVSFMLVFLLSPIAVTNLNRFSSSQIKNMFILFSILFVICPTLFGKDIFGFSEGKGVLWIAYLFLVGYVIQRYEIVGKYPNTFLKMISSGLFIVFLLFLMTKVSFLVHHDVSTANRFSVPWSLFSMYFSINCFIFFQTLDKKIGLIKLEFRSISNYVVISQILIIWPSITNSISGKYKEAFPESALDWITRIILIVSIYLFLSILILLLTLLISRLSLLKKMESYTVIYNGYQLVECLTQIMYWIYERRKIIYTGLFFYFFTAMQMVLFSEEKSILLMLKELLSIFVLRQPQLVLNLIIVMLLFLLIFLITKRFWYAFSIILTMELLITISNILKIEFRREPILPSDLVFLSNFDEILSMVSPIILIVTLITLSILATSTLLIQRRAGKTYNLKIDNKKRFIGIFVISTALFGLLWVNQPNSPANVFFRLFRINRMYYNQKWGASVNGPIIQFVNNIVGKSMIEPASYSEDNIEKIINKYNIRAQKINESREEWAKNQTVIFVLSESFSDPSRLPNITLKNDPVPFIRELSDRTTSGLMLSSAYGGGTANVEWQALTGLDLSNLEATLPSPYTQLVIKQDIAPTIVNLFDSAVAIHPYLGSFYNRIDVFEKFGFNSFHYLESTDGLKYTEKIGKNPYVSDESAYKETLDVINGSENETQFIQLTTMQNHTLYNDYYNENNFDFSGAAVPEANKSSMRTYLKGLNYSDIALKNFITELDKIEKPITLVWYGDHFPGIYDSKEIKKNPLIYRETDYFAYNNSFIQNQQYNDTYKLVSPYAFPAIALEQANLKVTPFYALLTEVIKTLPATTNDPGSSEKGKDNKKKIFVNNKNMISNGTNLSQDQKELLNDYLLIQYDLVAGNQYSAKWTSQKSN